MQDHQVITCANGKDCCFKHKVGSGPNLHPFSAEWNKRNAVRKSGEIVKDGTGRVQTEPAFYVVQGGDPKTESICCYCKKALDNEARRTGKQPPAFESLTHLAWATSQHAQPIPAPATQPVVVEEPTPVALVAFEPENDGDHKQPTWRKKDQGAKRSHKRQSSEDEGSRSHRPRNRGVRIGDVPSAAVLVEA